MRLDDDRGAGGARSPARRTWEPLIHSYYDGIGRVAHEYGLREEFFAAALVSVDALVGRLLHVLPESAALLVTSDHGKCMSSTGSI